MSCLISLDSSFFSVGCLKIRNLNFNYGEIDLNYWTEGLENSFIFIFFYMTHSNVHILQSFAVILKMCLVKDCLYILLFNRVIEM